MRRCGNSYRFLEGTHMKTYVLSLALVIGFATKLVAGDVYFRASNGVSSAKGLPETFDESRLKWKAELKPGNSTPCVSGDRVFLTTYDADKQELATVCLDRANGKRLWKKVAPNKRLEAFHTVGSPASSSPACNGRHVFVFFGSYGLICYDLDGNQIWTKEMGPFQDEFGASSSPVLVDGKVILNEDHDVDCFLIAIDQKTGETVWKTARPGQTRSYSTPIVWDDGKSKQLIVAGSLKLAAYSIETGKPIWWVNSLSRIVDTTPVISGGVIYAATWTPGGDETNRIAMEPFTDAVARYDKNMDGKIAKTELSPGPVLTRFFRIDLDQDEKLDAKEWAAHARVFKLAQNVAIAIKPGGKGDVTQSHVLWTHRRGLPTVPSPVVYQGVMYMVKDGGIITSLDAKTGEQLAQARAAGRGNYYGSAVAGDGKVYFVSERGTVTVLKAGKKFTELGSHDTGERIMATPVIANGQFFLRTDSALYCY